MYSCYHFPGNNVDWWNAIISPGVRGLVTGLTLSPRYQDIITMWAHCARTCCCHDVVSEQATTTTTTVGNRSGQLTVNYVVIPFLMIYFLLRGWRGGQETEVADQLQSVAAWGAGARLPAVSLPWRVHEGGARHEARPQGVQGRGKYSSVRVKLSYMLVTSYDSAKCPTGFPCEFVVASGCGLHCNILTA